MLSGLFDRIDGASLAQLRPDAFARPQNFRKFVHKPQLWPHCVAPFTRNIFLSPAGKMGDLKNLLDSINYMR